MKAVCINGSSACDVGSTQKIINYIFSKLPNTETATLFPFKDNILPCSGCTKCFTNTSTCIIKDDMMRYISAIESCDLLIVATPVYTNFMSASIKAVFDRIRPLQTGKYGLNGSGMLCPILRNQKRRRIMLVATCGFPEIETFRPTECWFESWCNLYDNFEIVGKILLPAASYIIRERFDLWEGFLQEISENVSKLETGQYFEIMTERVPKEEMINLLKQYSMFNG